MNYVWWLTCFVWVPEILLVATNFNILIRYWRTMLFCIFWALVFSVPWDLWAIRSHIWLFPPHANIGLWIGLPLEEYFFIIFVTLLISSAIIVLQERLGERLVNFEEVKRTPYGPIRFGAAFALMWLLLGGIFIIIDVLIKGGMSVNFGQYSYLITTLIFAGGAALIESLGAHRTLWVYRRVIGLAMLLGVLVTAFAERVALAWQLWAYDPTRTLDWYVLGGAIETYLFIVIVVGVVSTVTLNFTRAERGGEPPIRHLYLAFRERLAWLLKFAGTRAETQQ